MKGWTDKEVQRMLSMREQGMSFLDIGKKLGRSANGVRQKYYKQDRTEVQLELPLEEPTTEFVEMEFNPETAKWEEMVDVFMDETDPTQFYRYAVYGFGCGLFVGAAIATIVLGY